MVSNLLFAVCSVALPLSESWSLHLIRTVVQGHSFVSFVYWILLRIFRVNYPNAEEAVVVVIVKKFFSKMSLCIACIAGCPSLRDNFANLSMIVKISNFRCADLVFGWAFTNSEPMYSVVVRGSEYVWVQIVYCYRGSRITW